MRTLFSGLLAIGCGGRTDGGLDDGLDPRHHDRAHGGDTSAGGADSGGRAPVASGGFAVTPVCAPERCPSVLVAAAGLPLMGCCLPDDSCGIATTALSGVFAIEGGCQGYDQPGTFDTQCPEVRVPLHQSLEGCCRPDGTCGNDLTGLGLGCVRGTAGMFGTVGGGVGPFCSPRPTP